MGTSLKQTLAGSGLRGPSSHESTAATAGQRQRVEPSNFVSRRVVWHFTRGGFSLPHFLFWCWWFISFPPVSAYAFGMPRFSFLLFHDRSWPRSSCRAWGFSRTSPSPTSSPRLRRAEPKRAEGREVARWVGECSCFFFFFFLGGGGWMNDFRGVFGEAWEIILGVEAAQSSAFAFGASLWLWACRAPQQFGAFRAGLSCLCVDVLCRH